MGVVDVFHSGFWYEILVIVGFPLIYSILQVSFINSNGTENLNPRPPFKIKLPRTLKPSNGSLTGKAMSTAGATNGINTADTNYQKETLIIEAYTPPDPGPYPQDQPKQNSVRFTPTQVHSALDLNHIFSRFMHTDFCFYLTLPLASLTVVDCDYLTKIQFIHVANLIHLECTNIVLVFSYMLRS